MKATAWFSRTRGGWITPGDLLLFTLLLLLPWGLKEVGSYTALGTYILVWGLAAMGLNLLIGYAGQVSFGHAAFLGLGAYIAGLMLKHVTHDTLLATLVALPVGALAALVLGSLVVRLKGIYFATFTIAFSQLFYFIAFQWNELTGGDDGLRGFARQGLGLAGLHLDLSSSEAYYYFVWAVFVLAALALRWIVTSPLGRSFLALRENPLRARFLGMNVERRLLVAFALSASFTALAGALLAQLINFAQPSMLHWTTSGELVMMVFLGGRWAFYGPLLGAALFRIMEEVLSSRTENWMLFLGILFILVVLFFPRGIAGFLRRRE